MNGFVIAVMHWYSRHVLIWQLSNSMDANFCVAELEAALEVGTAEIMNTDQGSQFTGRELTNRLKDLEAAISMDGCTLRWTAKRQQ